VKVETVNLNINHEPISVPAGTTILDAAASLGLKIPTLCHDPLLRDIGACRVCQVEIEGRGIVPACSTTVTPGISVLTDSPAVMSARRTVLQLLLANHPESCLVCDKGNRCRLRDVAAQLGVGPLQYYPMPQFDPVPEPNPFIKRDMSKCILCGKCIRADQDLVCEGVLDYVDRGFPSRPATVLNLPLAEAGCTFCGTCMSFCPTGALTEAGRTHVGTTARVEPSICGYCGCGCAIGLEVSEDQVVGVVCDRERSEGGATLCVRGHFGYDYATSPERLTKPLVRKDGELCEVSWDEALDAAAAGLSAGDKPAAVLAGGASPIEACYLLARLARQVLRTPHLDNTARLNLGPAADILRRELGRIWSTRPLADLEKAGVVLVVGADLSHSAPVMGYHVKRAAAKGASLVVIDVRETDLAAQADVHLAPRPGTDSWLLYGLAHVLAVETKPSAFSEFLADFDPEAVAGQTGVPSDQILAAAALLAASDDPAVVLGGGAWGQVDSDAVVSACLDLLRLTGGLKGRAGGLFPVWNEAGGVGATLAGLTPGAWPGLAPLTDAQAAEAIVAPWGQGDLASRAGLDGLKIMAGLAEGEIGSLLVWGVDPEAALPDGQKVAAALDAAENLVVADLFLTPSAARADVVLPLAAVFEQAGRLMSLTGRVQQFSGGVPPPGEARPEWAVVRDLAGRLGAAWDYKNPDAVWRELVRLVPILKRADRPFKAPAKNGNYLAVSPTFAPTADAKWPFTLISTHLRYHHGDGARTRAASRLLKMAPAPVAGLSPADAAQLGVADGDRIKVATPAAGAVFKVAVDDSLEPGLVSAPLAVDGAGAAWLLPANGDGFIIRHCPAKLSLKGVN
jgi:formate dehydrogenase alpha subunit